MDGLNREILSLLQEDGRMSTTELAARVGLSLSACHRRVKELERSGALRGYRAVLDPEAVGLTFEAIVFVTLGRTDAATVRAFETAVEEVGSVVTAQRLFGDPDYILRVLTVDLDAFRRLYDARLACLPGVQRLSSTMVMRRVVEEGAIPIP